MAFNLTPSEDENKKALEGLFNKTSTENNIDPFNLEDKSPELLGSILSNIQNQFKQPQTSYLDILNQSRQGLAPLEQNLSLIQGQLAKRQGEFEAGANVIEAQPIAQPFLTGQQAQLERQRQTEIGNLTRQEALAQSRLTSAEQLATQKAAAQQADVAAQQARPLNFLEQVNKLLELQKTQAETAKLRKEAQAPAEKKYGPGVIGEYQYYTEQQRELGKSALSFDEYQDIDANRKRSISNTYIQGGLTKEQFNRLNTIADNARQDPNLKNFATIREGFETARQAASTGNSAGDIVLMRMLAKITDPTTGVREEEYRTFKDAIGTLPRYGVSLTKGLVGKGQLTSAGRTALLQQIQNIYNQRQTAYQAVVKQYETQATKAGGSLEDVIPVYLAPTELKEIQLGTEDNASFLDSFSNFLGGKK